MGTVSQKGQVTIPKDIRDALGIHPGDEVTFEETEDGFILRKDTENPFEKYRGIAETKQTVEERMRELRGER